MSEAAKERDASRKIIAAMKAKGLTFDLARQPDPNGDRVRIVMTAKFLKYKKN